MDEREIVQVKVSVVVPVYGCPEAIKPLCERLSSTLTQIANDYEVILVNDACPKKSWEQIEAVCNADNHFIGIDLARNFGQIRAITAGLDNCDGDWVVVMDCDLQDRPEGIFELYGKAQEGYDVVFARRKGRKDSMFVKGLSRVFYRIYNFFTDGHYDNSICNFSISRKEVIQQYCRMREQNRAYTLFLKWLGFKQTAIDIEADERYAGKSAYSFRRKTRMAIEFITAQSNKPLLLSVRLGFLLAMGSFVFMIWQVINYFTTGDVPSGWTSTIVSLYLLGGLILIFLGVLGIYIGYIFNEVKNRPLYVVRTVLNKNDAKEE